MAKTTDAAAGTPATLALTRAGIAFTAHAYAHDPRETNFGLEAAEKLGIDPDRVFKTLVVQVDGSRLAVGIVPVSGSLDLKAIAAAVGGKRSELAPLDLAERKTGYVRGGVSPIGQKQALPTVLDESAILAETILVSGGRRGLDVELAPDDLLRATGGAYGAIARP
ncbi:Cys-tRNA(Pro) deacylase [Agromyces seonyuensis]|uniref:Cys-tRNA(Pro)/Cys-tRNA(Cys) deacylase n=1 Tax=Agromyces seonyuensis TaxID=2662446 RepID=A0A6I4P1N2_9MICO|nr:Cys-tRNA(Pro) deacylase [Agromyces seonyuensis]MWB98645.1 Cys-tRNA(Pro) deacylase [Agromyces seonyuensis]